jgi:hypothetical protein
VTEKASEARRLISTVLIVIGTLWMGLSGLCTLGGLLLTCSLSGGSNWSVLWLAILPGAFSIGIGWLVRWIGGLVKPKPSEAAKEFE